MNELIITTKYNIGDKVQLMNGKIREIVAINIWHGSDYSNVRYVPKGTFHAIFENDDVACKLN